MHVSKLIEILTTVDQQAIVTIGDESGWSNIDRVVCDGGSCVKIVMSDNVVFSDDRASEKEESPIDNNQHTHAGSAEASTQICPECGGTMAELFMPANIYKCGKCGLKVSGKLHHA